MSNFEKVTLAYRKNRLFIDERSEIATEPAVRRLRGHDRASEETNAYQRYDLIPRRTANLPVRWFALAAESRIEPSNQRFAV